MRKKLIPLFQLSFRESVRRRNIIIFGFFVLMAVLLVHVGISEYRVINYEAEVFNSAEDLKAKNYGGGTSHLYYMPSAMCVFFNAPGVLKRTRAVFDDKGYLDVNSPLLGGSAFEGLSGGFLNYSGFLLYLGSLLALLLGWDAMRNRQYLRTLSGFSGTPIMLFTAILLSRMALVTIVVAVTAAAAWIFAVLSGMPLRGTDLIRFGGFNWTALTTFDIFLLFGLIIGSFGSRTRSISALAGIWFFFLILVPGVVGKITTIHEGNITVDKVGSDLDIMGEDGVLRKKEWPDGFFADLKDDYVGVMRFADPLLAAQIEAYMKISSLFPTTGYIAQSNELSSRGYSGLYSLYTAAALAQMTDKINRKRDKKIQLGHRSVLPIS